MNLKETTITKLNKPDLVVKLGEKIEYDRNLKSEIKNKDKPRRGV